MKTQSAKAKGRRLQQWVRDQLIEHLMVNEEDVESRSMGASGEDLIMARDARRKFPYSIECKNVEKLKQERTQIKDYSEEEWSRYQQALIQKEEAQKQRTEYLKKQDEQSAKRYDSIHSRMLENVWRQ